ncbi:MAG: 2-hydroxyacyl-CoA dehydratase subunit D [Planctomycetota bacterium]|jgi:benzoyl-CoA reductase/2-hydroxyglutaryl-CoA dehydratase subunit BcrC/BadD/HgdB
MSDKAEPRIKRIEATKPMGLLMRDYFVELAEAAEDPGRKVAWCTSVGPAELLRAFGFDVYFPENHGAMIGSARMAADLIPRANALGYSPDICSYLTSDIGAFLAGVSPMSKVDDRIKGVPRPDVLVFNTNQCRDVQDWLMWYGRHFEAPVIGVHSYAGIGAVGDVHVRSIAGQIEGLVPHLERICGRKFDIDRLREIVGLSRRCSDLWKQVLDTASARPAPLTFFDGTILMGPAVVLRGDKRANDFYELLLEELEGRVKVGQGAVEGEAYRIYWEGMPIWGRLRANAELFLANQACVVASTYCNSWIFQQFDPEDPFTSMARAYTELFIVRNDEYKEQYIDDMVRSFSVDGILFHDAKTCPNNSNCRYGMPQRYVSDKSIPTLVINGDLNDMRLVSDEQMTTNVEAFIEQLQERKAR